MPNSIDRCPVQQRYRTQDPYIFDTSPSIDDRFEDDDALDLRPHRKQWVLRLDPFDQPRSFQLTTHAHGIPRHRRRLCEPPDNATYPSLSPTRNSFLRTGVNIRLLDDLSRGLDWRSQGLAVCTGLIAFGFDGVDAGGGGGGGAVDTTKAGMTRTSGTSALLHRIGASRRRGG